MRVGDEFTTKHWNELVEAVKRSLNITSGHGIRVSHLGSATIVSSTGEGAGGNHLCVFQGDVYPDFDDDATDKCRSYPAQIITNIERDGVACDDFFDLGTLETQDAEIEVFNFANSYIPQGTIHQVWEVDGAYYTDCSIAKFVQVTLNDPITTASTTVAATVTASWQGANPPSPLTLYIEIATKAADNAIGFAVYDNTLRRYKLVNVKGSADLCDPVWDTMSSVGSATYFVVLDGGCLKKTTLPGLDECDSFWDGLDTGTPDDTSYVIGLQDGCLVKFPIDECPPE